MKRNISDLMDHIQDVDIPVSCQTPLSSQRIKELTMRKIKNNKGRRLTFRVMLVAAILVVLGVSVVAADQIWGVSGVFLGHYADDLEQEDIEAIDTLGASFPGGITSNGATITPISVLGDDDYFHMHIRVEAPEGVVLPDGIIYQISGMEIGTQMTLDTPRSLYKDLSSNAVLVVLPDEDPTDNVKEFVLKWFTIDDQVDLKFNDGVSKILTIHGLYEQIENGVYREIFSGDFIFDIGRYQLVEIAKPNVTGLSADYNAYTVTLQTMTVTPLSIHYTYSADKPCDPADPPRGEFVIVLNDGTQIETDKGLIGSSDDKQVWESWAHFYDPIELKDIDYILFGEHKIEVEPEPVQMAPLPETG